MEQGENNILQKKGTTTKQAPENLYSWSHLPPHYINNTNSSISTNSTTREGVGIGIHFF